MQVVCLFPTDPSILPSLAEACLVFSPQVAQAEEAVFVEVSASRHLFTLEECFVRLRQIVAHFSVNTRVSWAEDIPTALAFARFGVTRREALPVEALADFLSPFQRQEFTSAPLFRKLGVANLEDFLRVPRAGLASRFGKEGLFAYERLLRSGEVAWPRFVPPEKLLERADFDFASRVENLEPVLFLLRNLLHRIFLRLYARKQKLVDFTLTFHLNRFCAQRERHSVFHLPLPQSDPKALLSLMQERLARELELRPLEEALEGLSFEVQGTAPMLDAQREIFSRAEEEREAWASLVARLEEKLGSGSAFLAVPAPRIRPEASWTKSLEKDPGTVVATPPRPLRIFPPLPLTRKGERLSHGRRHWNLLSFQGPEKISGEWWLGGFCREYFRVETETETLWVFRDEAGLFLHGVFD